MFVLVKNQRALEAYSTARRADGIDSFDLTEMSASFDRCASSLVLDAVVDPHEPVGENYPYSPPVHSSSTWSLPSKLVPSRSF